MAGKRAQQLSVVHRRTTDDPTLAFGFTLTERLGAFAEAFGALALSDDAVSVALLNTGLTFLARRNLQFDAKVGIGLNREADAWFVGAGFAWRVPH